MQKIDVLDHGYVRLIDHMGDDLRIINSARASFAKESLEWSDKDAGLLKYLWTKQELSVFRHCAVTFEIKAPIFVCRQWWKYHVASNHTTDQDAWNEQSKRYVTSDVEFYVPASTQWRSAPDNKKQGSGIPMDPRLGEHFRKNLEEHLYEGKKLYEQALAIGVAPEEARLFLGANAQYTTWYWTTSLPSLVHFLQERLGHTAQKEIFDYATVVKNIVEPLFPQTFRLVFND